MGDDKKKGGGGGYKFGSALIWAGGQFAVCWFVTEDSLWATVSACFSAFFAGWTTSALLGRFAKWGANARGSFTGWEMAASEWTTSQSAARQQLPN